MSPCRTSRNHLHLRSLLGYTSKSSLQQPQQNCKLNSNRWQHSSVQQQHHHYHRHRHHRRSSESCASDPTPAQRVLDVATSLMASVLILGLCCSGVVHALGGEEAEKYRKAVPENHKKVLRAVAKDNFEDFLRWKGMPEEWWDDRKVVKVAGQRMQMFAKRNAFPKEHGAGASSCPLFMGIIEIDDISLKELQHLTEAHEQAAKLRFDPSIASFETFVSLEESPGVLPVRILITVTKPALLGLVGSREVVSVCSWKYLPDGSFMEGAYGFHSPRLDPTVLENAGLSSDELLREFRAQPPPRGAVRAVDLGSVYIHTPLDEAARSGGRGKFRCWYFLASDAGGGVPKWAAEKGTQQAISNFWGAALKELHRMRSSEHLNGRVE
eukprot:CAMPEP_0206615062 /NCGR_PEP_ID=MMETSP0325_2-20121206/57849_1 /ASSEMBLY_ACC=CAM_ASM_000347 /TAXON_ID=2866 /ORGANISM="Crypthecodinium cohnii, Strain Seligo" /LENGTH=381 /DNA_ID=CAMNT_0054135849 /DNA_START=187 /DNA_END=1332 /DNA_ORIENTATION=+